MREMTSTLMQLYMAARCEKGLSSAADRTNGMEPANGVQLPLTGQIGPVEFCICTCCAITADMLRGECINKTEAHTHIHMYSFQCVKGMDMKLSDSQCNSILSVFNDAIRGYP